MKVMVKGLKYIVIALILCIAVGGFGYFAGLKSVSGEQGSISAVVVKNELAAMNELGTMTYAYTELGKYENNKLFYGVKLPFTETSFILTYDGIIKAGIDMTEVQVELKGQSLKVILPEAKILSHEIDEESIQLYDEKTSIFNPFTVEDYTEFYADQKERVEKKALERGLLTEAQKQAETIVTGLLTESAAGAYTVEVTSESSENNRAK